MSKQEEAEEFNEDFPDDFLAENKNNQGAAMTHTGKHTPGPWVYQNRQITGNGDDGCVIANISTKIYDERHCFAEAEANARLIAAAPALLEALKAITQSNSYWWQEVGIGVVEKAEQAIKQAESGE